MSGLLYQGVPLWDRLQLQFHSSQRPSLFFRELEHSGFIRSLPELSCLIGLKQDPEHHPEGDVWSHTLQCLDAIYFISIRDKIIALDKTILMLSALCHDLGKCEKTTAENGKIISYGHERAGIPYAQSLMSRIGVPDELHDKILPLVAEHLSHISCKTPRAINRLVKRLENANPIHLLSLIEADMSARVNKDLIDIDDIFQNEDIMFFKSMLYKHHIT